MKKLIAIFVVLLLAAPAMAADWSFYGSQRIGTWYVDRDYGDAQVNGRGEDQATQMYFQGNSRFGARAKADKVSGQIELALGQGGDGGDTAVSTRRAYGTWKFSDNGWFKVGKDYSPVTDFISNQWFSGDNDLLGEGNFYGRRPAGLTLGLGNFEIAALAPSYGADTGTTATGINGAVGGDPDSYIPRFEAAYTLKLGSGYIKPFGGFQYFSVDTNRTSTSPATYNVNENLDVWSGVVGVSTNWNIGAFSIGGQFSYGINEGATQGWSTGSNSRASSSPYISNDGKDLDDVYTMQALLVAALKFTDTLRFEVGAGFRQDNADGAAGPSQKDEVGAVYLQALITMAPGVFLAPEVGYYDYFDAVNGQTRATSGTPAPSGRSISDLRA